MPGLGFAYAGYPIAANVVAATVILGVIGVQTLVVLGPSWIFRFYFIYIVGLSLQIINGVAAWLVAKRAKTSAPFRPTSGVRALVVGAVLLGGSAIVYPGYLLLSYKHFVVTSAAMEDCMLVGERFVVDMTAYRESSPRRGDVIVFVWPGDGVTQYVKRCIGVPGDTIEIRNKKVYINGQLEWNCLTCKHIDVDGRGNQIVRKEQVGIGSRDNMGIFIVSQERYFVLGDNRDNTSDSRFWGPVPRENILGKALRITSSDDPKRVGRFID
jgi:signal peptidase I